MTDTLSRPEGQSPDSESRGAQQVESIAADGYVVLATIAGESSADGKTPVFLSHDQNPFQSVEVFATRVFTTKDVGQQVVCMPLAGTQQLMIMGLLPGGEAGAAGSASQSGVLDEVLASTQSEQQQQIEQDLAQYASDSGQDIDVLSEACEKTRPANKMTVIADGAESEHLVVRAETAITLQCGEASISLTADGRVRINGRYVHTRASHTQLISGGAVKIN